MTELIDKNHSRNKVAELNFNSVESVDLENKIKVDSKSLPLFNQLLQFAPDIAIAKEISTNTYMRVIANGNLINAKDGSGKLGLVLGDKGITSHARLLDPEHLKNLFTTGVAFKAVSMAVGQAHLAEISSQLKKMNTKVAEIKQFLDDERASKIAAIDHYFDEYFLSANNSFNLSSVRRVQIEQDSREIDAILLHLTKEIKHSINALENLIDDSIFGSDKYFETLSNKLDSHLSILGQWFMVARVKAKAIQTLLLSNEFDLFSQRKNDFVNQINNLNKCEIAELREIWIKRINSFDAKLSSDKQLALKRNKLRAKLTLFLENINDFISYINLTINDMDGNYDQGEILLEIIQGELVNAYLPEPNLELMAQFKNSFLKNLGKRDDQFELVPASFSDDILVEKKAIEDLKDEQRKEAIKNSVSESLESTKEIVNDVGNKIGGVLKKFKW